MNKQEAMKILTDTKHDYEFCWSNDFRTGFFEGVDCSLKTIKQIDEPEKPVVPQFVADWYETNKYSLERNIYTLCIRSYQRELPKEEFSKWFDDVRNKAIETLVKMKLYGYEVEKEKLYTVEIPNPNSDDHLVLRKNFDGKVCANLLHSEYWRGNESTQLTEAEIKKDFEWAWQFAEEVEK